MIEQTKNLFKFLKAFNKLKIKPISRLDSFEKVIWLCDIPNKKGCKTVIQNSHFENVQFETLLKIEKPEIKFFPAPPKNIVPWLKDSTLHSYRTQPQIFSYILKSSDNHLSLQGEDEKIYLTDHPEIKSEFDNYIDQEWTPWAKREKELEPVKEMYSTLFSIYKKQETQGEVYQVVLGLGLLCSKRSKPIKRHIIECPISIQFESSDGTIFVNLNEDDVQLSLETDMFKGQEEPANSQEIRSKLLEFGNDFWKKPEFYNCLSSFLNRYDINGKLEKEEFGKPDETKLLSVSSILTLSPAIILKKRNNKEFIKFYDSILDIEKSDEEIESNPNLANIIKGASKNNQNISKDNQYTDHKAEKYYFPLLTNDEQEKIIEKNSKNHQVVVQGPPGTGKTHSIANLICHFLANGKKILVTSQTDRALKVLRDKLPKEIQNLSVEVLGKDQNSLQELKDSIMCINNKYQDWDEQANNQEIIQLNKIDDTLKGKIAQIQGDLVSIKKNKKEENLFWFYGGFPGEIANQVKNEEDQYQWIAKEAFNSSNICPISNEEAKDLFYAVKELKNSDEETLNDLALFLDKIPPIIEFTEALKKENEVKNKLHNLEKCNRVNRYSDYDKLKQEELNKTENDMIFINSEAKGLLNRNEKWVKDALQDCLADKDRKWKHLYKDTEKILKKNKNNFEKSEKFQKIKITNKSVPKNPNDILELTEEFLHQHKSDDKISWGLFSKMSPNLKKLKKIKMGEKHVESYKDIEKLNTYLKSIIAIQDLSRLWSGLEADGLNFRWTLDSKKFMQKYHILSDHLEPLQTCIEIHKYLENIKNTLSSYNIPQFSCTLDSIKEEIQAIKFTQNKRELKNIEKFFKNMIEILMPYKDQKNGIAKHIILVCEKRDLKQYENIMDKISKLKREKELFAQMYLIRDKLKNDTLYHKLKSEVDNPIWEERMSNFERAFAWRSADQWLKKKTDKENIIKMNQSRKDMIKRQKENMENLVSKKAWNLCLSHMTDNQLKSLKAWMQSITKIGKGTGKTATKHRRVAKARMEECKLAIPCWIMPLYRVVESIKPALAQFDVVIIDEASQTGPDGFLLNYLAKKMIVIGDKEQISPENPGIKDEDVEILKKKYLSGIEYSDHIGREYSYYDYCEITGTSIQLREHFRCMPEIIQFSNSISYTGTPLILLRQYGNSRLAPLKTTLVKEAISKAGSSNDPYNKKEAKALVDQIQSCLSDSAYKEKTMGIIVLQGKDQIKAIEKYLKELDVKDVENRAIRVGNAYDFQGDERDVIFLSMAIAHDWKHKPLTRDTYKKMYNVAASRAKDQMWLFHSINEDFLSPYDFRMKLLKHCKSENRDLTVCPLEELNALYKKIKETPNKSPDNAPNSFGSWFEARVFHSVASRGFHVISQEKVSQYKIDMVISGSNKKLAVECDGDHWHSSAEAVERDMKRQWWLERCGWTFWRLRESDFNRNTENSLEPLWKILDKMQIFPLNKHHIESKAS